MLLSSFDTRRLIRPAALLLAAASLALSACDTTTRSTQLGKPAPDFAVTDSGRTVRLSDFHGRVVVLNFWATWCLPCVEELPSLLAMQHRLPQITVLAISQDEDPAAYRKFLLDNHVDFLTLRDPSQRVPHLYGTIKIPETYIIDRNGILRRKFVSAQDWTSPEIIDYLSKL